MKNYDYSQQSPVKYGEFRLLKLHPGSGTTDLECNLFCCSISMHLGSEEADSECSVQALSSPSPEPYEALSYTWGPPGGNFSIKILAHGEAYRICIRANLDAALRHLRSSTEHKFFWIDALCINQQDDDEKSLQIQFMSEIYNQATDVCVWLGVEEDDSARAITFIKRCLNLDDFDRLAQDSLASKEWAALSALMRRPWFSRRWIIQEIALARKATLYCGKDSVAWRDFADVVSLFDSRHLDIRRLFRESPAFHNHPDYLGDLGELGAVRLVYAWENVFRRTEDGEITERLLSLEALMSSLSAFEASDPHDIVYAVLWLASDARPRAKYGVTYDSPIQFSLNSPAISELSASYSSPGRSRSHSNDYLRAESAGSPPEQTIRSANPERNFSQDGRTEMMSASKTRSMSVSSSSQLLIPAKNIYVENQNAARKTSTRAKMEPSHTPNIHPENQTSPSLVSPDMEGPSVTAVPISDVESHPGGTVTTPRDPSYFPEIHITIPDSVSTNEADTKRRKLFKAMSEHRDVIESRSITVDYKKSIFDVYKDFLAFTITRSKSLDMICRPWAPDDPSLPSWIPQLSGSAFGLGINRVYRRRNADPLVGKPGLRAKDYNAAKNHPPSWMIRGDDERSLVVKGFILSCIKEKKTSATAGIIPSEWMDAVGWTDMSSIPPDHFWRTLVGNRDIHGQRPPAHWKRVCHDAFNRQPTRGDLNTGELIMYNCPLAIREFLERVQCMVWSRRLVVLSGLPAHNSFGLTSAKSKKEDIVCILHGCSVPVLLRRLINGQPASSYGRYDRLWANPHSQFHGDPRAGEPANAKVTYQFIGECYVHGMMDGEAFKIKRESKVRDQEFELR